jgi:predicted dehydrogenase
MKKRRIIQVGVGAMGRVWADRVAKSDRWQPVAYVDVNPDAMKGVAAECRMPAERCYTDLDRALREVEADALLDVTPQQFRKAVCTAAFKRGLPVLCEKPLADSLHNAKVLVERAAKAGVTLMVAQNYRYQPATQTAIKFIRDGKLGRVGYVGVNFHKGPHFGGFREEMAYPLVLDMSIHHFDMMRAILGADVVAVQALSTNAPWNWNKGEATIMAQLEMSNGVAVNYFGSWVSRGAETPWNANWRFEGSDGVLLWEDDEFRFSVTKKPNKPATERPVKQVKWPVTHQPYLLQAFAEALDRGTEPETSGRDNLNSLATTYAVVRAAKQRRRVLLRELLG